MRSLFDKNGRYTPIALELDREAFDVLEPFFQKYEEFSPRDVAHILSLAVSDLECGCILDLSKSDKQP